MACANWRQVALDQPLHSFPENTPLLATAAKRPMPEAGELEAEQHQGRSIPGDAVVLQVPPEYTAQPLTDFRNGIMHPSPELGFNLSQFRLQPRPLGLPQDRKHSIRVFAVADMGKAQEVESLGLALSPALAVAIGKGAELKEPRLIRMQFKTETCQTPAQCCEKGLRVRLVLESHDEVVAYRTTITSPRA